MFDQGREHVEEELSVYGFPRDCSQVAVYQFDEQLLRRNDVTTALSGLIQ